MYDIITHTSIGLDPEYFKEKLNQLRDWGINKAIWFGEFQRGVILEEKWQYSNPLIPEELKVFLEKIKDIALILPRVTESQPIGWVVEISKINDYQLKIDQRNIEESTGYTTVIM